MHPVRTHGLVYLQLLKMFPNLIILDVWEILVASIALSVLGFLRENVISKDQDKEGNVYLGLFHVVYH